ncbi:hypothetical protein ABS767_08425 [Sphingomonas sp. ST-64]|uniref:Uncharacterized protein n=1 Tax=Sphingomonas plantiphila TaxID=3163295 RepID=A0ABW8YLN7_9SPHN
MIVRMLILLALMLGTLPAPSAAAPACHEMAGMTMGHDAPAPQPELPPAMGKALCVGCIAPATLKTAAVTASRATPEQHAVPGPRDGLTGAALTPEPPPPRA